MLTLILTGFIGVLIVILITLLVKLEKSRAIPPYQEPINTNPSWPFPNGPKP
jgi:hypothetical protein